MIFWLNTAYWHLIRKKEEKNRHCQEINIWKEMVQFFEKKTISNEIYILLFFFRPHISRVMLNSIWHFILAILITFNFVWKITSFFCRLSYSLLSLFLTLFITWRNNADINCFATTLETTIFPTIAAKLWLPVDSRRTLCNSRLWLGWIRYKEENPHFWLKSKWTSLCKKSRV